MNGTLLKNIGAVYADAYQNKPRMARFDAGRMAQHTHRTELIWMFEK